MMADALDHLRFVARNPSTGKKWIGKTEGELNFPKNVVMDNLMRNHNIEIIIKGDRDAHIALAEDATNDS